MNRFFAAMGWAAVGLLALVLLNLAFFGFVVGLDVAFGEAPQFTVPMFVPLLFCVGTILLSLAGRVRRAYVRGDSEPAPFDREAQATGARRRGPRAAVLHSALIIRRQPARHFDTRERRTYESTA